MVGRPRRPGLDEARRPPSRERPGEQGRGSRVAEPECQSNHSALGGGARSK